MRNLKITIRALSILLPVLLFQCNTTNKEASINKEEIGSVEGKTVMAIFAHPDDEMTVAPILSKYAREGAKVYLVICTDGRYGTNDFSGIEAGEGLVAIRKEEMKCAANTLGVELIHLNYHDQLKSGEGYDGHVPPAQALITELYEIVTDKKPDALITWGPDGGTTHMDHRLVGASVTQVFVSKLWEKPTELFYVGTPEPKQDKKILQKRAEFKSDMRFIQTIQGFRYRKERKTISIKEEKENCFIELLSEKELMKYIMRK